MTYAVWLMYAGAVLAVAAGVVGAMNAHTMVSWELSMLHKDMAGQPQQPVLPPVGLLTRTFSVFMVIGGVFQALLWLWMAWKNGAGRSWARVLSTVFFGIMCISVLSETLQGSTAEIGALIVTIIEFAVGLAAVIMLYRPESTAFYQTVRLQSFGGYPPVPGGYYGYGTPQSTYGYGGYPPPPPNPEDPPYSNE